MKVIKYEYSTVMELSITDNLPSELPCDITNIRAEVASFDLEKKSILELHNFSFVDRTVKVTIQLGRLDEKIQRLSRFESQILPDYPDSVFNIAHNSFTTDRRFHLTKFYNQRLATDIINGYLLLSQKLGYPIIAVKHKTDVVGFAVLKPDSDNYHIHLAAVTPKYQGTGAALSLYLAAYNYSINAGARYLIGRISTANTAVMNIYSLMNAKFSEPYDVFIKKIEDLK